MSQNRLTNSTFSVFFDVLLKVLGKKGKIAALQSKVLQKIRSWIIAKFRDPGILTQINGIEMAMPISHDVPLYLVTHKFYDTAIIRLTQHIRNQYGYLKMIDVGANIGDTILLSKIENDSQDSFVAVEMSDKYYPYLQYNCRHFTNIQYVKAICVSHIENRQLTWVEYAGTAQLSEKKSNNISERDVKMTTVDQIVSEDTDNRPFNFLKVDTDGFDLDVLAGAHVTIKSHKPVILFECDDFGITDFNQKCLDFFHFLSTSGYSHLLFYDNYGILLTTLSCNDAMNILSLLQYRERAAFRYFDIICMYHTDYQQFMQQEVLFFNKKNLHQA